PGPASASRTYAGAAFARDPGRALPLSARHAVAAALVLGATDHRDDPRADSLVALARRRLARARASPHSTPSQGASVRDRCSAIAARALPVASAWSPAAVRTPVARNPFASARSRRATERSPRRVRGAVARRADRAHVCRDT